MATLIQARRGVAGPYVNLEGRKPTYVFGWSQFALLASGSLSPSISIQGSATKVIKIIRVKINSKATAAGFQDFTANIYSSISGGTAAFTATGALIARCDARDPLSTATGVQYSVVPTTANISDSLRSEILNSGATPAIGNTILWEWGNGRPGRCPTLVGTSQWFGVATFQALAGQLSDGEIEWTEE